MNKNSVISKSLTVFGIAALMASYAVPSMGVSADMPIIGDTSSVTESSAVYEETSGYMHISCKDGSKPLSGVKWRVYYVGHREIDTIVLDDDFTGTEIDLATATEKDMEEIAAKLSKHIKDNGISADYTFTTDSNGEINELLDNGIYFLEMDEFEKDKQKWTAAPAMIEVTNWEDVAEVTPKISTSSIPDSSSTPSSTPDSSSTTSSPPDTPPNTGGAAAVAFSGAGLLLLASGLGMQVGKRTEKEKEEEENK